MKQKVSSVVVVDVPTVDESIDHERAAQLERFRHTVEQIGERNRNEDPDEVLRFVTEVVDEVRQERYEAVQRRAEERR